MRELLGSLLNWLRTATDIGLAVLNVLLLIDILFPGSTGIISNLKDLLGEKNAAGELVINDRILMVVVALLLFLLVYHRSVKPPPPTSS